MVKRNVVTCNIQQTSLVAQAVNNVPTVRETWLQSLGRKTPCGKEWLPTPVLLSGQCHGQRGLAAPVYKVTNSPTCLSS